MKYSEFLKDKKLSTERLHKLEITSDRVITFTSEKIYRATTDILFFNSYMTFKKETVLSRISKVVEVDLDIKLNGDFTILSVPALDFEIVLVNNDTVFTRFGVHIMYSARILSSQGSQLQFILQELMDKRFGHARILNDGDTFIITSDASLEFDEAYDILEDRDTTNVLFLPYDDRVSLLIKSDKIMFGVGDDYVWYEIYDDNFTTISTQLFKLFSKIFSISEYTKLVKDEVTGQLIYYRALRNSNDNMYPITPDRLQDYTKCPSCKKLVKVCDINNMDSGACMECSKSKRCYLCKRINKSESNVCGKCVNTFDGATRLRYHARTEDNTEFGRADLSNESRFKVGLEVEKEDYNVLQDINVVELAEIGWTSEQDGSLSEESGFELISPIYPLDVDFIMKEIEPINDILKAKTNKRCGGHIHVSDTQRTPAEILRDIAGYLPLLYMLYPSRTENSYSRALAIEKYLDSLTDSHSGHRQAINTTPNTLEFRIFPAVKDSTVLKFRLELVKYMLENPRTEADVVGSELMNENSGLFKILSSVLNKRNIKKKSELFVDIANYIDREGLAILNGTITRPRINTYKQKDREDFLKKVNDLKSVFESRRARSKGLQAFHLNPFRYGIISRQFNDESFTQRRNTVADSTQANYIVMDEATSYNFHLSSELLYESME